MTRQPLPHGLVAELHDDGAPSDRPTVRITPPTPRRRWGRNLHLWQTCGCFDCCARRAGQMDPYPGTAKK